MPSLPSSSTASVNLDDLTENEIFWRDHFMWLKGQGYKLQPRYAPDWVPSWKGTNKDRQQCHDGPIPTYPQINDAIHLPTGSRVALKIVFTNSHPLEESIMRHFSTDPLSQDPRSHCVPLLDVLRPPLENSIDDIRILVLPWLRPFNCPIFDTFGEAIDCIQQLFEGVRFMHDNRVAHRDLKSNNLMMEPKKMFPDGYHPRRILRKPDLSGPAKFYTRTQRPPRYFIIDLGFSRQYEPENESPLEATIVGDDVKLQNPFQMDVCKAGELLREEFLDGHPGLAGIKGYRGFEFLRPLVNDMVQDDPTKRPTMDEVMKRFDDMVNGFGSRKLRSRTSSRAANIFQDVGHFFGHWWRKIRFVINHTPAIPHTQEIEVAPRMT